MEIENATKKDKQTKDVDVSDASDEEINKDGVDPQKKNVSDLMCVV